MITVKDEKFLQRLFSSVFLTSCLWLIVNLSQIPQPVQQFKLLIHGNWSENVNRN